MYKTIVTRFLTISSLLLGVGCTADTPVQRDGLGSVTAELASTEITTDKGSIVGTTVGNTRVFLGISYAKAERFKPPQPADAWTEAKGQTLGPACPQLSQSSPTGFVGNEDCQNLNIWAPTGAPVHDRPVLVWIHGGGFQFGSGGDPQYDGKVLSEASGAIVVTINYRLGALGFLAHHALRTEDPAHPSSGMYGLEDQRAALAWVRDNIAAFGGDPNRVTLFGQSAGAMSVCFHMASPLSAGLFHRAIMESSGCWLGPSTTTTEAETMGDAVVITVGCSGAGNVPTCLRSTPTIQLLAARPPVATFTPQGLTWWPHIDGWNLPENPETRLQSGNFNVVPTLLGTNENEGTPFTRVLRTPVDDLTALMNAYFPGHGAAIAGRYLNAGYPTPMLAAEAAIGDGIFTCPTRRTARSISQAGANTYLYRYTHPAATPFQAFGLGAFHGSEIAFIFRNPYLGINVNSDGNATAQQLSTQMMGYWSHMAQHGNPNGRGSRPWKKYVSATDEHKVLDVEISASSGLRSADCDFWDSLVP